MTALGSLPTEQAARLYGHLIDRVGSADVEQSATRSLAVEAVSRLAELDPQSVFQRLRDAEDDSVLQQVLLLGLFDCEAPGVGAEVARIKRIGPGRADSMALILLARHADRLEPADLHQLGTIAAGGGRVTDMLQVQAAWLYLKHTDSIEPGLSRIYTGS